MDFGWVTQVAPVAVPAGAALAGIVKGQGRLRRNIRHDTETLKELSPESPAHAALTLHLTGQIDKLRAIEETGTRNPLGAFWLFLFAVGFGYGSLLLILLPELWWKALGVLVLVFALISLYLGFDNLVLANRDPKGARRRPSQVRA